MPDDTLKISDLIDDYMLPRWEDFPEIPGFRVQIRLPDVPQSFALTARALKQARTFNDDVAAEGELPPETSRYLTRFAVAGWEGLTVAGLKALCGQKVSGEDATIIPFSADNLEAILGHSGRFFYWVLGQVNGRLRQAKEEAAATENLSHTSNTTPTHTP